MPEPSPDDVAIATVLHEFFAAVSFPAGGAPEYQRLYHLFTAEGRLIRNTTEIPQDLSVNHFVLDRQRLYDDGGLTAFQESELTAHTDVFGRIAHRLSAYQKHGVLKGIEFSGRGVISTQFIHEPTGWKISSMAWDDERPGLIIPG
jgi:hypothetical protein